jgi:hypothetical protein
MDIKKNITMKTFLTRNVHVFEKILISFSQPLSTLFFLFHIPLQCRHLFKLTNTHSITHTLISLIALFFLKSTLHFQTEPSISSLFYPSLTNEDNMSQYFFSYQYLKDTGYLFSKCFLNSYIYAIWKHKIPE